MSNTLDCKILLFGDQHSPHVHKWVGYLESAGSKVDVVGYGESLAPDNYQYRNVIERGKDAASKLGRIRATIADLRLLRGGGHDAVNLHFLNDRYAFYCLATTKPVLLTCWGTDILVDLRRARGLSRCLRLAAIARADRITCDSSDVSEEIARADPRAREKIKLVFWGVDENAFTVDQDTGIRFRRVLGIPENAIVLLSNRLCAPHYRIHRIIATFVESIKASDIFLVVRMQSGCSSTYRQSCVDAADSARNVKFVENPLSDEELPSFYRCADIVLHYPQTDATPVSMLEALATGRAVVCSDDVPAYQRLSEEYHITRLPLSELKEGVIRHVASERLAFVEPNRETLIRLHSRAQSVESVAAVLNQALEARRGTAVRHRRKGQRYA